MEQRSDRELVRDFKKGNENGFDELVRRYEQRIYNVAWRMVRNSEDALELSQETFVRAYRALRKFKEKSSFYTWLYRICFNLCLTFLNKSKKIEQKTESLDTMSEERLMLELDTTKQITNQPEIFKKRQDLAYAISSALDQLPLQQRTVFVMRQYDELDNDEIAKMLDLSIGGVKSNYHHAIKKLQILLKNLM
jgi:RNA polymerase sigma-70 factor (ECF subfamily)